MRWEILRQSIKTGFRLAFEDKGPGIPDLGLALTDGLTSGSGMRQELFGARCLVNEFDMRTALGEGTCVVIARWK